MRSHEHATAQNAALVVPAAPGEPVLTAIALWTPSRCIGIRDLSDHLSVEPIRNRMVTMYEGSIRKSIEDATMLEEVVRAPAEG